MKLLTHYIQEKFIIKKNKRADYKYFPQTKKKLKTLIEQRIKDEGNLVNLNNIDVSNITNMSRLFEGFRDFNGDISNWDVSNVKDMSFMFNKCREFNQDISNWNVYNVTNMNSMFLNSTNLKTIYVSNLWNVDNVTDSVNMFGNCKSLVGATSYDSTKKDKTMANYTTGYLTYKANN